MKKIVISAFTMLVIVLIALKFDWNLRKEGGPPGAYHQTVKIGGPKSETIEVKPPNNSLKDDLTTNLQNTHDSYIVTVDTHAVEINDIDVSVVGTHLNLTFKISGSASQRVDNKANMEYLSRYMGQFNKRIELPGSVATDKISTQFNNGILTVTMPKT